MSLEIQFKLKNNPQYLTYLRDHSLWYKELNRDPTRFRTFEEEVKDAYGLRPTDRISKALDTIELVQNVLSTLR